MLAKYTGNDAIVLKSLSVELSIGHEAIGEYKPINAILGHYYINGKQHVVRIEHLIFIEEDKMKQTITPEIVDAPTTQQSPGTQLATVDFMKDVKVTSANIVYDKAVWLAVIDKMELEEITPKFLKSLNDDRIQLVRQVNAQSIILDNDLKEVYAYATEKVAGLKREAEIAENTRKADKKVEVAKLIMSIKKNHDLPDEYLNKVLLKEEYLQKGYTGAKLNADIEAQIENLAALKKGDDDAKTVAAQKLKIRELTIAGLNTKYGFSLTLSDVFGLENDNLEPHYIRRAELRKPVKEIAPVAEDRIVPVAGNFVADEQIIVPGTPMEPKSEVVSDGKVYRKVLIGADSQGKLMQAIGKLKRELAEQNITLTFTE